jgi:two-component system, NtrC family, response regulator AtoC
MGQSILIVDDEKSILTALRMALETSYTIFTSETGSEALRIFSEQHPDLILLDIGLPDVSGLELLDHFLQANPEIMVIMITAVEDLKMVIRAIKAGSYDYLVKPLNSHEVKLTIKNALEKKHLKQQLRSIQKSDIEKFNFDLVGKSSQVKKILEIVRKVAASPDTPILITGQTGTGKGVIARAIHYRFSDLPGPFVTVNCTAITHELFESELFGYEKGAFTGARGEGKKGRFEQAEGGTIFLDEIGSMSVSAQAKLLGVLEDRVYYRVGGTKSLSVSSRVIAATNHDLEKAVDDGNFRSDLFFRLNVVKIEVPPLRERPDDILPLTGYYLEYYNRKFGKQITEISPEAGNFLLQYPWPGNVRELRNSIERIVLLESGNRLIPEHFYFLRSDLKSFSNSPENNSPGLTDYDSVTKALILKALKASGGNVVEAARLLNLPTHKIRYRIKKYGLKAD